MNKIFAFSLSLVAATAFVGCSPSEEDDIFPESAAERLNDAEEKYTNILTSSPGGWAMEYYCTNDTVGNNSASDYRAVGYLLGAKFNTNGTVDMGMNNVFSGNQYISDNSLWDIVTDTGPVLSFSSYNRCIHCFADPNNLPASIKGGAGDVTGLGAEGDFEFVLTDVQDGEELAQIKGKKRSTYIRLTRLPEGTDFNQYINDCDSFRNVVFGASNVSEPIMRIGSHALCLNSTSKAVSPKIYPYQGDSILTMYRRPFLITKRDGNYYLRFKEAFSVSADSSVQEFVFNPESNQFTGVGEGNEGYTISGQDPLEFLSNKLNSNARWRLTRISTTQMSESFRALIDAYQRRTHNFANLTLSKDASDGKFYFTVQSGGQFNYEYNLNIDSTDNSVTFSYVGPKTTPDNNRLNRFSELKSILDTLSQKYIISSTISAFNLSRIRFTSASDSNLWFELTLL